MRTRTPSLTPSSPLPPGSLLVQSAAAPARHAFPTWPPPARLGAGEAGEWLAASPCAASDWPRGASGRGGPAPPFRAVSSGGGGGGVRRGGGLLAPGQPLAAVGQPLAGPGAPSAIASGLSAAAAAAMAETEERSLDDFFAKRDKKKRKERSSRAAAAAAASSSGAAASHNAAGAAAAAQGPRPADGGGGGGSNAASSGAAGGLAKSKVPGEGSRLPPAAAPGRRRLPAGRGQPRQRRRPGHAGGWGGCWEGGGTAFFFGRASYFRSIMREVR